MKKYLTGITVENKGRADAILPNFSAKSGQAKYYLTFTFILKYFDF